MAADAIEALETQLTDQTAFGQGQIQRAEAAELDYAAMEVERDVLKALLKKWLDTIGSVDALMEGPRFHLSQKKLREVIPETRAQLEKSD